ncbi:pyridoxamine 5'-phosphate oxidase [Ginsengibacter hankyongi]|uniref:pyridoxamine 5'-phosphate oxidase n=1 Tax=Ginsengibacter hankyongi TaxID=2607284 RepID=UPI001F29368C|nr:pyridoxamine 5'-phosphate oxidase [Ginsengibacter hankyongi]
MQITTDLAGLRKEYRLQSLLEKDVDGNPMKQFEKWWHEINESAIDEANAMTLATCTRDSKPTARIVLLKEFNKDGFVFFSNYESNKGRQLNANPFASLVFFWKELERQVRIEGTVEKISEKESDEYFSKRPLESRIGAWSSPQSQVIKNREVLENNFTRYSEKFSDKEINRPPHWGGYILKPNLIEFWQGGPGRLHDRLRYIINEKDSWIIERLAP